VGSRGVVTYADGDRNGYILGSSVPWDVSLLALDPHDPCRIFAGLYGKGLAVFRHTGIPGCPAQ